MLRFPLLKLLLSCNMIGFFTLDCTLCYTLLRVRLLFLVKRLALSFASFFCRVSRKLLRILCSAFVTSSINYDLLCIDC